MLADFYHLTASPIERVLPQICEKLLAGGERLLVVAEPPLLAALDGALWTYSPETFLPHGQADGPAPEAQPVLLSADPQATNGARNVALADGIWRGEALGFDRCFYFFDTARRDEARTAWRALADTADVERRYWKQENGRWVQGP